jgi:hypothetical protein
MPNLKEVTDKVIAALLTIAWANTKDRDVSQKEIKSVYENFGGK